MIQFNLIKTPVYKEVPGMEGKTFTFEWDVYKYNEEIGEYNVFLGSFDTDKLAREFMKFYTDNYEEKIIVKTKGELHGSKVN